MASEDTRITLGVDFDDTLWHTTTHFERGRAILEQIAEVSSPGESAAELVESIEQNRISTHGYGYASFVLASIEALLATEARSRELATIEPLLRWAHETAEAPVDLIDGVEETLPLLAEHYHLIGITRGSVPTQVDLFVRSGLREHFGEIEVLGRKTVGRYESILRRNRIPPDRFVMLGDSIAADVEPVLAAGARAIHIPYRSNGEEEGEAQTDAESALRSDPRWMSVESFSDVPAAVERLLGHTTGGPSGR